MMIKKTYLAILSIAVVSVLLGSLLVNNVILAQTGSGEYDPWLDSNEDGIIDVYDLSPLAQAYGSSGDTTKNVTVTNFPTATESVCVVLDYGEYQNYNGDWRGIDIATKSVTGIGGKTVKFISGSVSGGGTQCVAYEAGAPHTEATSERTASGWVNVTDSLGTVIAQVALPLTQTLQIDNVDSFTITVGVPYSLTYKNYFTRQAYAVAGVTYEVLE